MRRVILLLAVVAICAGMVGCAGTSVHDMVKNPRESKMFFCKKNYQELVYIAKQHLDKNIDNAEISTTIYDELNIAEITVQAGFGFHICYIKISQGSDMQSKVEIYIKGVNPGAKKFLETFNCDTM